MTKQDLEKMTAQGEGLHLEFKHRLPESERIAREVTALGNTHGGHLLIGVTDDGKLSGVKDPDEELFALNRALKKHCSPEINFKHEKIKVSRTRAVVVIKIPVSLDRPHYVEGSNPWNRSVFVRLKDMCVEASNEARKLMKELTNSENVLIQLGDKERLLLKHLEQMGTVTVKSFSKYARIHPGRASRMIVRMTRANILVHHIDVQEDYFTQGTALTEGLGKI